MSDPIRDAAVRRRIPAIPAEAKCEFSATGQHYFTNTSVVFEFGPQPDRRCETCGQLIVVRGNHWVRKPKWQDTAFRIQEELDWTDYLE